MRQGNMPAVAQSSLLLEIVKKSVETDGLEQVVATVSKVLQDVEVAGAGLEPARGVKPHRILSPVRLPISPPGRTSIFDSCES